MRKKIYFIMIALLIFTVCGCEEKKSNVKVYEDTEEQINQHDERSFTAIVANINLDDNYMCFIECNTGAFYNIEYHGGVGIYSTHDKEIGLNEIKCGSVVDVTYYSDTNRLVSISQNKQATTLSGVNKFTIDLQELKAKYKGTSIGVWEHVIAFDEGKDINIMEINTEDQVTLNMYNNKLVSVVVELGHGYVRLENQDSYIGGMVEIGYDVIVPVANDMLLAVREGDYTLRINRAGFSNSKPVTVCKGEEVVVDLADIAIPTGTAVFTITPGDAKLYIGGELQEGHAYTSLYGSYNFKIEAEGYKTRKGSYKLDETIKKIEIELVADGKDTTEGSSTDTTTTTTEPGTTLAPGSTVAPGSTTTPTTTVSDTTTPTTTASTTGTTEKPTTEEGKPGPATEDDIGTTELPETTENKVTIKAPIGVSVYLDGEYVGVSPVSFPKVVGTHTIILYQKGYLIKSYSINSINNGKDDEYSFPPLSSLIELIE